MPVQRLAVAGVAATESFTESYDGNQRTPIPVLSYSPFAPTTIGTHARVISCGLDQPSHRVFSQLGLMLRSGRFRSAPEVGGGLAVERRPWT